jgi:ribose 1,5-bisphosphate isomerase
MSRSRRIHTKVETIIAGFEAKQLHASRSGREVIDALGTIVAETSASSLQDFEPEFIENIGALLRSLQAYAPTVNVLHRLYSGYEKALQEHLSLDEFQTGVAGEVEAYNAWSAQARLRIADLGRTIIPQDSVVYTFTLSETVLTTLIKAWKGGVRFKVLVTESRPNNDGNVTARSLAEAGVEVEVSIDACMSELIRRADLMIVGAEAVMADGSAICKVGTFPSAVVARQYGVPIYVFVDTMKYYVNSLYGMEIELDRLQASEIMEEGQSGATTIKGHLFDRTPAEYIKAVVSELGIQHPTQVGQQMLSMPISESLIYGQ